MGDRVELVPPEGIDIRAELQAYRDDMVREAISRTSSWTAAAALLGLPRSTLGLWAAAAGISAPGCGISARDARVSQILTDELGWSMAQIAEYLAISDLTVAAALARGRSMGTAEGDAWRVTRLADSA